MQILIIRLILTVAIGIAGAVVAEKLHFPAPWMLGSLIGVAVFSVLTDFSYMPSWVKVATQTIAGAFVGCRFTRKNIKTLYHLIVPAIIQLSLMLISCIAIGTLVYKISDFDYITSALSTSPGGIVDTTLIGLDLGANTAVISLLHTVRLTCAVSIFPAIMIKIVKKLGMMPEPEELEEEKTEEKKNRWEPKWLAIAFGVAAIGGAIGKITGVPAGVLTFSMVSVALLNIFTGKVVLPPGFRKGAQVFSGALIGTGISMAMILQLKSIVLPVIVLIVGFFFMNLMIALILHKLFKIDMLSAFFASTPGGVTDLALMIDELGGRPSIVSILQISRLMTAIAVYPTLVILANRFFGG